MSERSRKKARRAARAVSVPQPIATAKPASNRSTFRVAQALREAAAELPGIVRNRQAERQAKPRPAALDPLPLPAPTVGQAEAKRTPSRIEKVRPSQPKLDRGNIDLKCPPKSTKPGPGGGSGRKFVPWDKDC